MFLKAGQISLHHSAIVHVLGLNKSNDRKIEFVVQGYIGSNVDQVLGKMYAQQARGDDTFKYHQHIKRPSNLMNSNILKLRRKQMLIFKEYFDPAFTGKRNL